MQKILIIRFSSIGDIVLTSPVIRCVKNKYGAQIHFLTKEQYGPILDSNPYVDKIILVNNNFGDVIKKMKVEKYDCIIDLQNNFKSLWVKLNLSRKSYTIRKENWKKYLLIYFAINLLKYHTVDRYFDAIKNLHIINDNKGLDYFVGFNTKVDFDCTKNYIAWCIGASYNNKALSTEQIIATCNQLTVPVVLLGGHHEAKKAEHIINQSSHVEIYNFCGKLSLHQSAHLTKNSSLFLTNDTGLMHIAAAFHKPTISFWGCTNPVLGFTPYMNKSRCVNLIAYPQRSPCSRHGSKCKTHKDGCIKNLDYTRIIQAISEFNMSYVLG